MAHLSPTDRGCQAIRKAAAGMHREGLCLPERVCCFLLLTCSKQELIHPSPQPEWL